MSPDPLYGVDNSRGNNRVGYEAVLCTHTSAGFGAFCRHKPVLPPHSTSWDCDRTVACAVADELLNQNEVLTIASVSSDGLSLTTQQPLLYNHYGEEYKAEVALLTRPILFTSDELSSSTGLGGQGKSGC